MTLPPTRWIALGLFVAGAIVLTLIEWTLPGLLLLAAAIVLGVFTIVTPELLAEQADDGDG
jgi:drug/metabolite transporter (DMT)-like permease